MQNLPPIVIKSKKNINCNYTPLFKKSQNSANSLHSDLAKKGRKHENILNDIKKTKKNANDLKQINFNKNTECNKSERIFEYSNKINIKKE